MSLHKPSPNWGPALYRQIVHGMTGEGTRFLSRFRARFDQYREHDGKTFKVIGREDSESHPDTYDEEVGHLWRIRFEDGTEIVAWPEEVEDWT